jgi:hypothetical protein
MTIDVDSTICEVYGHQKQGTGARTLLTWGSPILVAAVATSDLPTRSSRVS